VIFAIPWLNHAVIGTTDTPRSDAPLEPRPLPGEIDFILETIAPYLSPKPQRSDIRSVFAGIRPLVRSGDPKQTSKLGRDHEIRVSDSELISVLGGKWTTYRRMAEDAVDRAASVAGLRRAPCSTESMRIHGYPVEGAPERFRDYGADAAALDQIVRSTAGAEKALADRLPYLAGQAVFAARHELARTVEDVLARRLRALFLDAEAALAAAPRVAEILAAELGRDEAWQADQMIQFRQVAEAYRPPK
jgi:glycerol-3-phosphate dehydrogenase